MDDTSSSAYTARLQRKAEARWKVWFNVQAPYQWNLRRQQLGRTVDVGCGIGRNLMSLDEGSVGVDHNETSVRAAQAIGLPAMTSREWAAGPLANSKSFDSLLFAHVIEHLTVEVAQDLVAQYLTALRPGGRVLFICPQEKGFASDPTHVTWTTGADLAELARSQGLLPEQWKSFPAPRFAGRFFTYNEFTLVAHNY